MGVRKRRRGPGFGAGRRPGTGTYRRCRVGPFGLRECPGYWLTRNGVQVGHRRCGGDGWIKVDDRSPSARRRTPGAQRPRRPRGTGRTRRRVAATTVGGGLAWVAAERTLGALGTTVVAVVFVTLVVLKVAASGLAVVARTVAEQRASARPDGAGVAA